MNNSFIKINKSCFDALYALVYIDFIMRVNSPIQTDYFKKNLKLLKQSFVDMLMSAPYNFNYDDVLNTLISNFEELQKMKSLIEKDKEFEFELHEVELFIMKYEEIIKEQIEALKTRKTLIRF